jgi:hypothetical protein
MEQTGPDLSGPMEETENYRKLMDKFGIDAKRRPASGTKIAEFVHQSDMYKPRFKVHSKLVHPTALSIAAATTEDSLTALMPLFSQRSIDGSDRHLLRHQAAYRKLRRRMGTCFLKARGVFFVVIF